MRIISGRLQSVTVSSVRHERQQLSIEEVRGGGRHCIADRHVLNYRENLRRASEAELEAARPLKGNAFNGSQRAGCRAAQFVRGEYYASK